MQDMPDPPAALRQHSLGDLLRRTVGRMPGKLAVLCGETRWSYAELDRVCNRLAHGLAADAVGADPTERLASEH